MFVAKFPYCQQVKSEHLKSGGLTESIDVPTWKWDSINMEFIVGFPRTYKKNYYIWVIVDRFTKSAHFIPVKSTNTAEQYARIYISEIVSLHGIPLSIILDRGAQFTSHFWKAFQKGLGTHVKLSTSFHRQTDGQAKCTIKTLEDMFRACVIDFEGCWDDHITLIEFSYNNSYHSSISMAHLELSMVEVVDLRLFEVCESSLLGRDIIFEAIEMVQITRDILKAPYSQQKSYADNRSRDLEFEISDHVYLKISPMKGVMRFGRKGKLIPQYVCPY